MKDKQWYFIVDGDPQFGVLRNEHNEPISRIVKNNVVSRVSSISKKYPINFVICAGDLTSNGFDGKGMTWLFKKRRENQLEAYVKEYETPLQSAGFPVFACPGNLDFDTGRPHFHRGVIKYLNSRYGATYTRDKKKSGLYSFSHKGILFISMGLYPYDLKWLKKTLPEDRKIPIIFFWHFNTIRSEPNSNDWTDDEKLDFRDQISSYNVQLIINGHFQSSGSSTWNGIPIIRGSGSQLGVVEITAREVTCVLFDNHGE